MARPRKIQLDDGEITLQGFTSERADEIEKKLLAKDEGKTETTTTEPSELKESAVGMYLNSTINKWEVVMVKYNPVTKEAKVVDLKPVSHNFHASSSEFKVVTHKLGLV